MHLDLVVARSLGGALDHELLLALLLLREIQLRLRIDQVCALRKRRQGAEHCLVHAWTLALSVSHVG